MYLFSDLSPRSDQRTKSARTGLGRGRPRSDRQAFCHTLHVSEEVGGVVPCVAFEMMVAQPLSESRSRPEEGVASLSTTPPVASHSSSCPVARRVLKRAWPHPDPISRQ